MPKLSISVNHKLSPDEATMRIKKLITKVKATYGKHVSNVSEQWKDNTGEFSFTAMGTVVAGSVIVHEKTVDLNIELPWSAVLFKGKIESVIKEQAQHLLK